MAQKQYLSLTGLKQFFNNLKDMLEGTFSALGHKHRIEDIEDLTIDSELSDASTNPIQNKVISEAMLLLGEEIDGKAAIKHTHSIGEIGTLQAALDALQTNVPVEPITSDELAKIFNGTY